MVEALEVVELVADSGLEGAVVRVFRLLGLALATVPQLVLELVEQFA